MMPVTQIRVLSLAAVVRGDNTDLPVVAGFDGNRDQVVMVLDREYADELAQIIGVGTTAAAGDLLGELAVWNRAIVALKVAVDDLETATFAPVLGIAR